MLERKSFDLQQSVQRCRAYASPLRKVPAEIWIEIFSEYIQVDGSLWMSWDFDEIRVWSSALPLSQTCSFWRAIALSAPKLWSSLSLDLSGDKHGLGDLVQLHLRRSDPSPLMLDMYSLRGAPSTRGWAIFWNLVNTSRSRWLSVKMDIPWEPSGCNISPQKDVRNQFQFDILRELEVSEDFDLNDSGNPPYHELAYMMIKGSPLLRLLKVQGLYKTLAHSFVNLNEIHLKLIGMQELVDCFTLCPQLCKATLFSFYLPYEDRPLFPLPTKITHHKLSCLELEFIEPDEATAILSSLVLPSLITLNVKFDLQSFFERNDDPELEYLRLSSVFVAMESLKTMVTQSSCPLEELELGAGFIACGQGASDRALIELFALTPKLTRLRIDAQRYSTFSDKFFQSLTFSAPSVTAQKDLLPLLKVLHLRIVDVPQFHGEGPLPDPDLIFTMVNSRRVKGCTAQLKMFHFSIQVDPHVTPRADEWVQFFTTITEPRLRDLEADGLGLSLRVVSKECRAVDWL
ncbi:hypothetical protein VKT23_000241 [Stygiomarasmius scandens]|uniref:F-box domain-containing protein n=1 Tax=Marasmiellus scandens TaxID=2682957 RepID=A0ABR1K619_9AGAR